VFEAFGFNAKACESMVVSMSNVGAVAEIEFVDDDVASPDLYKFSVSPAYDTITILWETKLHLKKDKFYGLSRLTSCCKTSLMRAIS